MITPETQKKIALGFLIFLVVCGALFVLFAIFINRGKLTIVAEPPFMVAIGQMKTQACPDKTCTIEIAPGDYAITISKQGNKDVTLNVTVPIGGEHREEITFSFIPFISKVGDETTLRYFATPNVTSSDLPKDHLFYDQNYVTYLKRNTDTHRQTLYVRGIQGGELGPETIATSFLRDMKEYRIIPDIDKHHKIAVIDQTDPASQTLYMIDLTDKSRTSLFSYPIINDVKWFGNSDDFLFEARDPADLANSIFLYGAHDQKITKLDLKTSLKDVVIIGSDRLIAATTQHIGGDNQTAQELEGQLVVLGEQEATGNVTTSLGTITVGPQPLNFVDYSLTASQARLLKSESSLTLPAAMQISETGKSTYFLVDGTDYEFHISE
jgi:hypothetical protein